MEIVPPTMKKNPLGNSKPALWGNYVGTLIMIPEKQHTPPKTNMSPKNGLYQ